MLHQRGWTYDRYTRYPCRMAKSKKNSLGRATQDEAEYPCRAYGCIEESAATTTLLVGAGIGVVLTLFFGRLFRS